MAGNAEILKAYVTLAADTSSLRTSLTAASAEVEAWKRKTQVTIPLYQPGMAQGGSGAAPGARPGPSVLPTAPIVQPIPTTFTESLKRGTAGVRGFSNAIQGTLGIGLRFMGWVGLAGSAIVGLGRLFTEGERRVVASNKAYNEHADGLRKFRESVQEVTEADRVRIAVSEKLRETLKKIDDDENLTAQRRVALAREAREAARDVQASMERLARRNELTAVQTDLEKTTEAFEKLTAAPVEGVAKLTQPFDELTASIQRSITAAMQADSSLVEQYEELLSKIKDARTAAIRDMAREQRDAVLESFQDVGRMFVNMGAKFQQAQDEQAKALQASIAGLSRDIAGIIQGINIQNIEGGIDSIRQQVSLLARR